MCRDMKNIDNLIDLTPRTSFFTKGGSIPCKSSDHVVFTLCTLINGIDTTISLYLRVLRVVLLFIFLCSCYSSFSQCVGTPGQVSWHYWENIYDPYGSASEITFLYEDDTYPDGPDVVRTLNSVTAPSNYQNYYAAITKGFISVPNSGPVTFNLTGDDYTLFFLSTDASRNNLDTAATAFDYTGSEEYNRYPSQTSSAINMVAGQQYYFEIHHRENGGGDHATLRWQRPYVTDSTWTVVSSPFLTDVCDPVCLAKGTPCNDNNSSTFGDVEDGNCNCLGQPDTTGLYVGNRGELDVYFYDSMGDGNIDELIMPNFPSIPSRMSVQRNGLFAQWTNDYDYYASLIQGYFLVPVTGNYDFNLTGARNVEFRFNSAGPAPSPNQTISIRYGSDRAEHDKDLSQTITGVSLTAGTYYYFETVQAVSTWGDYLHVFWKVPGHSDSEWHFMPETYLFDYTNESACLPQGTTCDDMDPFTANDQVNASCECVGTPCTPFVDCDDPGAEYVKNDYCDISNELGNRSDDAWLSCDKRDNPYLALRNGTHWIHYDLGDLYVLKTTRVWNYNVSGNTSQGFQNVSVDYSSDGINWTEHSTPTWGLANGDNTYTGFEGPDFGSVAARYVMFSSTDSGSCRGISKVAFTAEECKDKGSACDDGDMATVGDHFDEDCNCIGYSPSDIDCGQDTLYVNQADIPDNTYHAMMALMSGGTVLNSSNINYKAGAEIVLGAGFEVQTGSTLSAEIEDCVNPLIAMVPSKKISEHLSEKIKQPESLSVFPLTGSSIQTIRLYLPEETDVRLEILDINKNLMMPFTSHHYPNHGDHYKRLETKKLTSGIYLLKMTTDQGEYLEKIIVT